MDRGQAGANADIKQLLIRTDTIKAHPENDFMAIAAVCIYFIIILIRQFSVLSHVHILDTLHYSVISFFQVISQP